MMSMRKVLLARGGALSPFSGLGGRHAALRASLESEMIEDYTLAGVHENPTSGGAIRRVWRRWFSGPSKVAKASQDVDLVHITDQEQAGLVPADSRAVVTVHDLFHLFPNERYGVTVGDQKPGFFRRKDLVRVKDGLKRAKLLICISKDTQQECEMRFPGVPTAWVPHAVDLDDYSTPRERPSWMKDGVNLIVLGSEEPRKRMEFAIQVCAGMNVTLHKLGAESSPRARTRLETLAKDTGCNLNWIGRIEQDELIAALQHADALLFPSIAEGFGLPPLEAYASGTVALVADAPAHNEIPLEHHILPPDDVEMWKTAIQELEDESEVVRARAAEFSEEKWLERMKSAYDSVF